MVKSLHVEMIGKSESLEIWRKYSRCQDDAIVAEIGTKMPPPPACPSKEDVQSLQPTAFFSFLNIECHIIDLNIQICSELHSRAN